MKVLIKNFIGELKEIEMKNDLSEFQRVVGGYIEVLLINPRVLLIVNEEGKLDGLPPSFNFYRNDRLVDVIVGNAVFVGHDGEEFNSLTDEEIKNIKNSFKGDKNEKFYSV